MLLDNGELCPDHCDTESCVATYISNMFEADTDGQLNILRTFRDELLNHDSYNGATIEKYYTISASVMDGLKKDADKELILNKLHADYFYKSIANLKAENKERAFELFEECMQYLTDRYLLQ